MRFYKALLWWNYYGCGYGMTNIISKILMVAGIGAVLEGMSSTTIILYGMLYVAICVLIGWAWFKFGFAEADAEVKNNYNLFVKQVRGKIRSKTFK
jgi:hypothetical protein